MSEIVKKPETGAESTREKLAMNLESLKADLPGAPVFAFLEKFDVFSKKRTRALVEGEVLFEPGEDPNFYIIASGALKIFRFNPTGEKVEIGRAYAGTFLGEGVLSGRNTKEFEAVAYAPTSVVVLQKADFDYLESQSPETLMRLYRHMNDRTSQRLTESGKELALLYETTEKIESFRERGERGFLDAVNLLKESLNLDYVLVLEQHPAVPGMFVYKYNTKFPSVYPINQRAEKEISCMESGPIADPSGILGAMPNSSAYGLVVHNSSDARGFLVLGKKTPGYVFRDHELRIAAHFEPLLASMIENNQRAADQRARAMLEVGR